MNTLQLICFIDSNYIIILYSVVKFGLFFNVFINYDEYVVGVSRILAEICGMGSFTKV